MSLRRGLTHCSSFNSASESLCCRVGEQLALFQATEADGRTGLTSSGSINSPAERSPADDEVENCEWRLAELAAMFNGGFPDSGGVATATLQSLTGGCGRDGASNASCHQKKIQPASLEAAESWRTARKASRPSRQRDDRAGGVECGRSRASSGRDPRERERVKGREGRW